jgi:spermidine synthase
MQISGNIKDSYSAQYDQDSVAWRNTGAKYKALNIIELSKSIQFKNVLEVGAGEGSILKWLSGSDFCDDLNCVEISESGI